MDRGYWSTVSLLDRTTGDHQLTRRNLLKDVQSWLQTETVRSSDFKMSGKHLGRREGMCEAVIKECNIRRHYAIKALKTALLGTVEQKHGVRSHSVIGEVRLTQQTNTVWKTHLHFVSFFQLRFLCLQFLFSWKTEKKTKTLKNYNNKKISSTALSNAVTWNRCVESESATIMIFCYHHSECMCEYVLL